MIRHYLNTILLLSALIFFNQCAQIAPLTGGARDTSPPKLLEASPQISSLNFKSNTIVLRFDEYIKLKDIKNQLLVSPTIKTDPEISTDGKKLKVLIKSEELLPNTTYRIYFGSAVADMTEGNAISNFQYIFSTGSYIDSLKLSGTVTEAVNNHTAADALVGLYNINTALTDSAIYKIRPDYITKTNNDGKYTFTNLPERKFKLIAFSDKNKNNLYDPESEKIGFWQLPIDLKKDTLFDIKIFPERSPKIFIKKTTVPYYGALNVIYNRPSVFNTRTLKNGESELIIEAEPGKEKDTLTFYYHQLKDTLGLIIYNKQSQHTDTVKAVLPKFNSNRKKNLQIASTVNNKLLSVNVPLQLTFLNKIDTLKTDLSKLHLAYIKDVAAIQEPLTIKYNYPVRALILNKLIEGIDYKLKIDTAAFFDLSGRYNDSVDINFKLQSRTELGKLSLKLLLNTKQAYVIQLINDKEKVVSEKFLHLSLSSSNAATVDFIDITPGIYTIKVVYDDNENNKWDAGNYLKNKQSEKVFISSKQIKILSDWEMEEEILVK
ncbi:MAG: Ig-like domain-containing protein [Bacteroidetes bacterium]|nr:Ig-like domain-containing protein [Bacteroidota bacterium]